MKEKRTMGVLNTIYGALCDKGVNPFSPLHGLKKKIVLAQHRICTSGGNARARATGGGSGGIQVIVYRKPKKNPKTNNGIQEEREQHNMFHLFPAFLARSHLTI
jgi:hypothetical protein